MAILPVSTSQVNLCSGIPFHADYQHTRWFASKSEQTAFFNNRVDRKWTDFTIQKLEYGYVSRVPISIEHLRNINYLFFSNNGRTYYCFVNNLEYKNEGMTQIHFDIDYIQTYMFDISFRQSYVVREHPQGVLNTNPEGLHYGDKHENILIEKVKLFGGTKFMVVVSKTPLHDVGEDNEITPSIVGVPQPLHFYVVPYLSDKSDDIGYVVPMTEIPGTTTPTNFTSNPTTVLKDLYSDSKTVNNVVSIYITEFPGFNMTHTETPGGVTLTINNSSNQKVTIEKISGKETYMYYVKHLERSHFYTINIKSNFRDVFYTDSDDPGNKLKQSPYAKIILDDMKGHRVEYLPEYIYGDDLILNVKGGLSHNSYIEWGLENYTFLNSREYGEQIVKEHAIVNANPQDVAIINDMLAAYMQGNKNSLKVKQDNIAISGLMGTFTGLTQGAASGVANPTPVGIAGGIASGGLSVLSTAVDTQMQIKSMQAQIKDISNVPPSIQKMGANIHNDFSNKYDGIYIIYKQVFSEYRSRLADYFKMYGYKTDRLKSPNLTSNPYFNYVQTKGLNINGNFNNEVLTAIKRIFDNGITLWHTDAVGNYNVDNRSF